MNRGFQYNAYLLLYFLWEFENATQSIANFICIPLLFVLHLIFKLFGQKITWEKRLEQGNKCVRGLSMSFASKTFSGLPVLLEFAVFNFIQAITGVQLYCFVFENEVGLVLFIVVFLGIVYVINSLLIDDSKVPLYFKRFNEEFKECKWKYRLKCTNILLSLMIILVCSCVAMHIRFHNRIDY